MVDISAVSLRRKELGLTVDELAFLIGIPVAVLRSLEQEQGEVGALAFELRLIRQALGLAD